MSDKSDGSTASYYELPEGCTELQHLISYRNLNAQDGEIFRAIYRKGRASHSDELRDARKVLFYAKAEVERLEALAVRSDPFPDTHLDFDEERVDRVANSHGDGEHYDDMSNPANWRAGDLVECVKLQPPTATKVGGLYRLISVSGIAPTIIDEEGDSQLLECKTFRFHSRPSADGWIDWPGGECPCDENSRVEVEMRNGTKDSGVSAGVWQWKHFGNYGDIIRYRML